MELIELTNEFAVNLTICTNDETLGIDSNDPEVVTEVGKAAEDSIFNSLGCFGEEESNFKTWNGGFGSGHKIATRFYKRDIDIDDLDEIENLDDLFYTNWQCMDTKEVPAVIRIGIEKVVIDATQAMDSVLLDYAKQKELEEAEENES